MPLGLGSNLSRAISKPITPGIVTDNLVLKHKYDAGSVVPISDGSVYTNGVSDNINFGPLDMPSGAFTIGGWFWFASGQLEERPTLIGRATWAGTTKGFILRFNTDSSASDTTALHVTMGDATSSGNNQTDVYSTTIVRDQWNHIMLTVDGEASGSKTLKCYLNGALDSTHTSVHYVPDDTSSTNFLIHKADNMNAADSEVKGYVCNCALWQTDLTQAQIKSIMNKKYAELTDSEKTNLVSWWNLDTAYDSIVFDNHHNGGETLGSELLTSWTNNDFTSFSSNGTDITSAVSDGSGNHEIYSNQIDITAGDTFKVTFTIGGNAGSGLDFRLSPHSHLGSADYDTSALSAGTYEYYIKSGITDSTSFFGFRSANQTCDFSISNFSVKKINGNTGKLT